MVQLVQRDPDNIGWQLNLWVSHNCVAHVYEAQGQLAEALREFEAELAVAERLAGYDPTNARWQQDLADTRIIVDRLRREFGLQP